METVTVEIINSKAYRLLEDLEALNVIRLHKPDSVKIAETPEFGFAKDMIKRIDDDFNEPLSEFSDYMP
ncbi:hypothetical protein GCM10023187_14480 [Nibrella viscosa]|uniref:DUF2281 domain-containing protein n=1 Tax=Nibrella viscosa TaxID=1084524 RepID=A0ABP8K5X5_9BACT